MADLVMVSFQKIYIKIIDLFVKRIIFLFLLGIILSLVFVNHGRLKLKTLNVLLPSTESLREFVYDPNQISKEKLITILNYYKSACDYMDQKANEKPAPCGITGYAYYYLGDQRKSMEYFEKAIKLNKHFFWFHYNMAMIHYNEERYDQAMKYFVLAKEAFPYTVGFFLVTKTHQQMSDALGLSKEDYERSLVQAGERIKKFYALSQMFFENPELKKEIVRTKIDLQLF